jgi:hypothetical protein
MLSQKLSKENWPLLYTQRLGYSIYSNNFSLGFFLLISLESPLNTKSEHKSHFKIHEDSYFNSEFFVPVCILLWYVFSSIIFKLLEQEWTFIDAFYFCFVTMTGVGFGDFIP